jgi:hypothetical protein
MPQLVRRPYVLVAVLVLAGCAEASHGGPAAKVVRSARPASLTPIRTGSATACSDVVAATLLAVGRRIYGQAAHGRNVVSATRRLAQSPALAAAVAAGDPAATRAALVPLLKHQIRRIIITRGAHVLADVHGAAALAPVHGVLRDAQGRPVGRYVLAVAQDAPIAGITRSLTGARVTVRAGTQTVYRAASSSRSPSTGAHTVSYAATAFPRGRLRVALTIPPAALTRCGATPRETVARTVGAIGERLARTEAGGPAVARALRHAATDPQLRTAVAQDDPVGLRAAIIRFFHARSLHIVRVRATTADGRLVGDVGGPYVLSPASTTVRDAAGRPLGRVTLAVQDDTGYIKLMHRFTGAAVLLRTAAGAVPGSSMAPGPATVPPHGALTYGGRRFDTYTFTARAFPDGPLSVALLLPRG